MTLHIGTSGWSYDHWQDVLYPPDTPVAARLPYYLQRFRTVEVNSTYYRWPADPTLRDGKDSQETGQIEMVGVQRTSLRPLPVHELITGVS